MAKVLLGFMGAGKSTIARGLDPNYLDMDALIEKRLGMSIANFFAEKGESAFRQVESEVLADLLQTDQVVSTGGGVVISQRNRDLLKTNTDNIYLKADFETLYQRIAADKDNQRPLFLNNSKEELVAIFQERQAWYEEVASRVLGCDQAKPRGNYRGTKMKIAYLGPKGSFSHHVVQTAFPHEELQAFANITDVIKAYEQGLVDYSVVPVENSIEGSVHETLDYLFHQAHIQAVAEIVQPIHQQLMVVPGHTKIEKIFSHPQALAQGKKFIDEQYPEAQIEVTASTAYAARFISEHPDQPFAAVAPRSSAEEYGLELIAEDIQEMEANFTRFWVLGAEKPSIPLQAQTEKMSLALTLPDNLPGALYKALSTFAWRGIDLTKIESRPLKTALGEYFFIIDVDYTDKDLVHFAQKELEAIGIQYKILGTYPIYPISDHGKERR
ncbi:prephenate dehydratase [Streptococcus pneumoniae]|nr:prephenate dehydratase [Streptococcus pneumoniae]